MAEVIRQVRDMLHVEESYPVQSVSTSLTAQDQIERARKTIDSIDGNPTLSEHWKKIVSKDSKSMKKVKEHAREFCFDFTDPRTRDCYFKLYQML